MHESALGFMPDSGSQGRGIQRLGSSSQPINLINRIDPLRVTTKYEGEDMGTSDLNELDQGNTCLILLIFHV